jgi:hypothetical protein
VLNDTGRIPCALYVVLIASRRGLPRSWQSRSGFESPPGIRKNHTGPGLLASPRALVQLWEHYPSGSDDTTVRIWNAAEAKEIVRMIVSLHGEWLTMTPDSFFSLSDDGLNAVTVLQGLKYRDAI